VFKKLSGLKDQLKKSEIFCFDEAKKIEKQYTQLFGYKWEYVVPILGHTYGSQETEELQMTKSHSEI
jgi:siderophore synthetase component